MGCVSSQEENVEVPIDDIPHTNVHNTIPDLKVHTVITNELDFDHTVAMSIPLGEISDEQLVAEIANRKLDAKNVIGTQFDLGKHERAMEKPLKESSDVDLLAEVKRRRLDIRDKINEALVYETYEMGKRLGKGASGEVLLCRNKDTSMQYACKVIKRDSNMNDAQSMSTEIEILKRIRHRNIVSMIELYETPRCLWIILELVDAGDLRSFIQINKGNYSENMAATHTKQILQGVHYLHSMGVIHRDLKLENILLKKSERFYEAKIADFGLSALVRLGEGGYDTTKSSKRKQFDGLHEPWGTVEYEAPELLDGAYGPQADVWAVGCILFEILSGEKAFAAKSNEKGLSKLFSRIKRGEIDFQKPSWKIKSSHAKDLVSGLLRVDPRKRLSATEALQHRWILLYATLDDSMPNHA